jgi:pyruvate,water dikinase
MLDVRGVDNILGAIGQIWVSATDGQVATYLQRHDLGQQGLQMAVLIQEMVQPTISGVVFSRNPITGLDEVVVEAVAGRGDALVQEGVTPARWVHKWGAWMDQPTDGNIPTPVIEEVVHETRQIAKLYGSPVDLEWVYDGNAVYWVQLREITALAGLQIYSNRIAREVLPGIIKPLVWSVNVPLVNAAWIRLFTELIGPNDIQPEDLAKAFHYRAYFNMSTIGRVFTELGLPRESLELLLGLDAGLERPAFKPTAKTLRHAPRMVRMLSDKARFGRRAEAFIPIMRQTYQRHAAEDLYTLTDREILAAVEELFAFTTEAAYFNIVVPSLQSLYAAFLKKRLAKLGVAFEDFDLTKDLDQLQEYSPSPSLEQLHASFAALPLDLQARIRGAAFADLPGLAGAEAFHAEVEAFLHRFGHLSDSGNDFSAVPWRENPDLVLHMVTDYTPSGRDRNQVPWHDVRMSRSQRSLLRPLYRRARDFRLYREAISFYYTLGYGLFRHRFLELGRRLQAKGAIAAPEDVFYLYLDELTQAVENVAAHGTDLSTLIAARQAEIEQVRAAMMPDIIYGEQPPPAQLTQTSGLGRLQGTPTSRGYYEGLACVVERLGDFGKMFEGAVLVIPYSDVSWTPLFAKAGAVIAESGGILSHTSIIAREYNLPAVVSVTGACRLCADQVVAVNGYTGEIIIRDHQEA